MKIKELLEGLVFDDYPPILGYSNQYKEDRAINESVIGGSDLVDVYLRGQHRGETFTKLIAKEFPNQRIPALIQKLVTKYNINPASIVYGPSQNKQLQQTQQVNETPVDNNVIFLNNTTAIVGQKHGKKLNLSPTNLAKIQKIANQFGAWYEGNGSDSENTQNQIDKYQGSWDDVLSQSIKEYPYQFIYTIFSNVKENDTAKLIGSDSNSTIFDQILKTQKNHGFFPDRRYDADTLKKFLQAVSQDQFDFLQMSQRPATERNVAIFLKIGEQLMWPNNWEQYPNPAGQVAKFANDIRDKFLATRQSGVYVTGSDHLKEIRKILKNQTLDENFADGQIKGKSRPGRVKRAGASCSGSVTELRARARKYGGERGRMYHWCANMKSGRRK